MVHTCRQIQTQEAGLAAMTNESVLDIRGVIQVNDHVLCHITFIPMIFPLVEKILSVIEITTFELYLYRSLKDPVRDSLLQP